MRMLRYHVVDHALMVSLITNAVDQMVGIAAVQCGLISKMINVRCGACYWVTFDQRYLILKFYDVLEPRQWQSFMVGIIIAEHDILWHSR